jgi:23S rRNA pseudouridine1911/1915/1917 synthase
LALVWGNVKEEEGTIRNYLGRSPKNRKLITVFNSEDEGKLAITHYKVLERFNYFTLVECQLETGRTHQIRVHMKHIGHPLFHDLEYGGDSVLVGPNTANYKKFIQNCFELIPGQALHAKTLGFVHPETNEELSFESELPEGYKMLIDKIKKFDQ